MDCSSVSITAPGLKEDWRVDVPMRSFQGGIHYTPPPLFKDKFDLPIIVQVTTLILFHYTIVSESSSDKPISHILFLPFFPRQPSIPRELQLL